MTDVKLPEPVRAAFEAWHVNFYKEPLPREWRIVDVWQCWQAAHEQGRLAGLAEAAQVCETMRDHHRGSDAAAAIRAIAASDGGK
jgi:hypothetical protein